jgi:hypothetical protein
MAKAPKPYTRLTRSAWGVGSYASLWLAADHLLLLRSSGYSEEYSRMQLRDIRAFFIVRTARRLWFGVFWGVVAVLPGVTLLNALSAGQRPVISIFFLSLIAGFLLWNFLLGPGCTVYIATGVQNAKLPALVRVRKARRVMGRIQPLIDAAQADLVPPLPVAAGEPGAAAPLT